MTEKKKPLTYAQYRNMISRPIPPKGGTTYQQKQKYKVNRILKNYNLLITENHLVLILDTYQQLLDAGIKPDHAKELIIHKSLP